MIIAVDIKALITIYCKTAIYDLHICSPYDILTCMYPLDHTIGPTKNLLLYMHNHNTCTTLCKRDIHDV